MILYRDGERLHSISNSSDTIAKRLMDLYFSLQRLSSLLKMGLISASFISDGKDDALIHMLDSSQRELHNWGTDIFFYKGAFQAVVTNSFIVL